MFPWEHHSLGAFPSGGQGGHLCLSCHRLTSQVFSLLDAVLPFPPPAHWFSKNGDTISKPPTAGPDAAVPVCCVYGTGNRASFLDGCFLQPRQLLLFFFFFPTASIWSSNGQPKFCWVWDTGGKSSPSLLLYKCRTSLGYMRYCL